jgi:23S rRNA pseudouridine1911/1915/1917 synthase
MSSSDSPQVHTVDVAPGQAPERLDKWLAATVADLSRTRIRALIDQGAVSCGGETVTDPSHKVKPGESFTVTIPEAVDAIPRPQDITLTVVYEDEHLIVIDKPAGMVVHPAPGSSEDTLVNALLAHCGDSLSGIGGVRRPGIVHRLDKDTSGLLVAAKSDAAHAGLAAQFADHSIERAYWALVWGVPTPPSGRIEGAIGRSPHDRKKMAVVRHGGKHAATRYKVLQRFGDVASLIECRLETGRTHQIRVHLTSIGHPLIGDPTYGQRRPSRLPEELRDFLGGFHRQALHAFLIGFTHPITLRHHLYQSRMPRDIKDLVSLLECL